MFFSCFFFNLLILNSLYFLSHIFSLSVLFSVLVDLSLRPPFFPIPYFVVIIFAHFSSCFQYLQESFNLFILICSSLSIYFFVLFRFGFFVRLSNPPPFHPSNPSNSSSSSTFWSPLQGFTPLDSWEVLCILKVARRTQRYELDLALQYLKTGEYFELVEEMLNQQLVQENNLIWVLLVKIPFISNKH